MSERSAHHYISIARNELSWEYLSVGTFCGFPDSLEHRVKTLDERHQIYVVSGVADALAILMPVQHCFEVVKGAALGPEAP